MTLADYLKNDPVWQAVKKKSIGINEDKVLTKIEFLKTIGSKNYSENAYQKYLRQVEEQRRQSAKSDQED